MRHDPPRSWIAPSTAEGNRESPASLQQLEAASTERHAFVNHCSNKTTWLIAGAIMVAAIFVGQVLLSRADERVRHRRAPRSASPAPPEQQAAPLVMNVMHRLPPVLGDAEGPPREFQFDGTRNVERELPDSSQQERQLFERGSTANWNQDPANRATTVQLLARQDELPGPSSTPGGSADRGHPRGQLPVPAKGELVTMHLSEVNVRQALEMLSRSHGLSILVAPGVTGLVTANLEGLQVDQALDAIVKLGNLVAHREGELIYVYSPTEFPQGNFRLHVFPLNFVSAIDVLPVVTNLLTPTGQATASSVSPTDNTKAREAVIVTDRPEILERVDEFIRQVDVPPLQVMIEAHVLKIELTDDLKHGVNYKQAMDALGSTGFEIEMTGLADAAATPAVFARIAGSKVEGLLQLLKTTTNAKTLASPRVMVINGQKAHIQVGEQIPYKVVTVTETTAIESIQFLNVGVVLDVTPRISQDGRVMMRVNPKVSSGTFNPETKLPGETTRELESDVILEDGLGMVIGGLIQEKDIEVQSKLPYLGDLHYVGRLFQRRTVVKERSEIVITLVPRIIYNGECVSARDMVDAERSQTPLLQGALHRFPRPWEPQLPDAIDNPNRLRDLRRGRCRGCQYQPCACDFGQPVNGFNKPLAPTPVAPPGMTPGAAFTPPIADATWVSLPPSGTAQRDPPPVQVEAVYADGNEYIDFATDAYPAVPRAPQQ